MINYYSSLKDFFIEANGVQIEDYIGTLGFEREGDGGGAIYQITETTLNEERTELYINGEYFYKARKELKIIPENSTVYIEQFGARGDVDISDMTDVELASLAHANSLAITNAIKSAKIIEMSPKTYIVDGDIEISENVKVKGNNAILKLYKNTEFLSLLRIANTPDVEFDGVEISDLNLSGVYTDQTAISPEYMTKGIYFYNSSNVTFRNLRINGFDLAVWGIGTVEGSTPNEKSDNIRFINCVSEKVKNGMMIYGVTDLRINNLRLDIAESNFMLDGVGLLLSGNCYGALVEDLSVFNAKYAPVICRYGVYDDNALHGIFFKNLLVDSTKGCAVYFTDSDIPVRFANAMIVNAAVGMTITSSKNISMINSSVLINNDIANAMPKRVLDCNGLCQAKFTKTQFEFPADFQTYSSAMEIQTGTVNGEEIKPASELSFADCTLQKTDMAGTPNVTRSTGFGTIGYSGTADNRVIELFDACEFRSYQSEFVEHDENEAVAGYKFPVLLSAKTGTNSKTIIKNCRFVNDSACSIPYFRVNSDSVPGNIVVYNCFFENYIYSESEAEGEIYPIFATVNTDNVIGTDTTDFNIFAKCNMRSSTPARGEGTVINETKIYQ